MAQETVPTRIAQMVIQMDWNREGRIHLSGALFVYVSCVHLCCESVRGQWGHVRVGGGEPRVKVF
jgi:hypothetical protein